MTSLLFNYLILTTYASYCKGIVKMTVQRAKQTLPLSCVSSASNSKMAAAHMFSLALLPGLALLYEEPIVL